MNIKGPPGIIPKPIPRPKSVKKKVLERHVEQFLYDKMKKLGGECYKWSSANLKGVPDRICIFPPSQFRPNGLVTMVELKKDVKQDLTPPQVRFFKRMDVLKVNNVYVLKGKSEVILWLKSMGYDV